MLQCYRVLQSHVDSTYVVPCQPDGGKNRRPTTSLCLHLPQGVYFVLLTTRGVIGLPLPLPAIDRYRFDTDGTELSSETVRLGD